MREKQIRGVYGLSYLKEILAVCSTAVAVYGMVTGLNGTLITAVVGFWGTLLGHEISVEAAKRATTS